MVANVTRSRTSSRSNWSRYFIVLFIEGPDPRYAVLEFGDSLSSGNWDMVQNVISLGHDSFIKVKKLSVNNARCHLHTRHVKFPWNLITSFSVRWQQSLTESWLGERKTEYDRNTLTQGDTLWRKLHYEGATWRKMTYAWFQALFLNFHLV